MISENLFWKPSMMSDFSIDWNFINKLTYCFNFNASGGETCVQLHGSVTCQRIETKSKVLQSEVSISASFGLGPSVFAISFNFQKTVPAKYWPTRFGKSTTLSMCQQPYLAVLVISPVNAPTYSCFGSLGKAFPWPLEHSGSFEEKLILA